jgi:hypothetical protein
MVDAGLEPERQAIVEIGVQTSGNDVGCHYWPSLIRSLLPRILDYAFASEADVGIDTLEQRLIDESTRAGGIIPTSPLLIAQWARKPLVATAVSAGG